MDEGRLRVTRVCMPTLRTSILAMFVGDASHTFPGEPVMWPLESLVSTIEPWPPTCPTAPLGIALRELATKDPGDGGLGLFKDGSQACKDVFSRSPSAICDSRPAADLNCVKLLEGNEHLLHRMAAKDLEQRSLGADGRSAILNLGDITSRIRRSSSGDPGEVHVPVLLVWKASNGSM